MHFIEPHDPYEPPEEYKYMFDPNYEGTPVSIFPSTDKDLHGPLPPRKLTNVIAQYDGEIAYVDFLLGNFFDYLKEIGLYDSSLIIVVADHGEEFYEHQKWGHSRGVYREITKVPIIIKWPDNHFRGTRIKTPAELVDIKTTILDCLGYKSLTPEHGNSLLSILREPENESLHHVAYGEDIQFKWRSIRTMDWAYIEHTDNDTLVQQLYTMTDIREENNLFNEYPEIVGDLKNKIDTLAQMVQLDKIDATDIALDAKRIRDLRNLGYIQ